MSIKLTTETFIARCRLKHGDKYDYSRLLYLGCNEDVEVGCPLHGWFWQKAVSHSYGHGCRKCGDLKVASSRAIHDSDDDIDRILSHAVEVCGGFPSHDLVVKHQLWDAQRVILKLGGWSKARKYLGFLSVSTSGRKITPKGYWTWDTVVTFLKETFPLMYEAGQLPTREMMIDAGVFTGFFKKCGGTQGVCDKLGLQPVAGYMTRDGHFVRSYYELLVDEYLFSRGMPHEPEFKPFAGTQYRCDQKIGDLYLEIWGYLGAEYDKKRKKKERLYKKNGLKLVGLEADVFKKTVPQIEKFLDELFSAYGFDVSVKGPNFSVDEIAKHVKHPWNETKVVDSIQSYINTYGEFPSQKKLLSVGLSHLSNRINQYGGFDYFRKLMGYGKWVPTSKWSEAAIVDRFKEVILSLGNFPKNKLIPSDLRNAIHQSGKDTNYYRTVLGYEIEKKSAGYWTDDNIHKELLEVINEIGHFPSSNELISTGRGSLSHAIQSSHKFSGWRKKMGDVAIDGKVWKPNPVMEHQIM